MKYDTLKQTINIYFTSNFCRYLLLNFCLKFVEIFQALSGLNEILKHFSYDTAIKSFPNFFNVIFLTFAALIDVGSPVRGTNKNLFVSYKEVYDINPAKYK